MRGLPNEFPLCLVWELSPNLLQKPRGLPSSGRWRWKVPRCVRPVTQVYQPTITTDQDGSSAANLASARATHLNIDPKCNRVVSGGVALPYSWKGFVRICPVKRKNRKKRID